MLAASVHERPLRILHVLRAPLGGLFRHVLDLTREQAARGHSVGLIADQSTGGARADSVLAELAPNLALGVSRVPMRRNPYPGDIRALGHVVSRIRAMRPDVVHGHGSKGGLYARATGFLPGASHAVRAYTPHGGSFNYKPGSAVNSVYMAAERMLAMATDVFLFESRYIANCFSANVGHARALQKIVCNGITDAETVPVPPAPDAAEFVYVGELRSAKGIDTMLDALAAAARRRGSAPRAVLVGSGPDQERLNRQAAALGLADFVTFPGPLPAREAFTLGRTLVVPSRAESLPYVVLEAAGAHIPMIATNVGGIPEIFGPYADRLIPCDDVERLSGAMLAELGSDEASRAAKAAELSDFVAARFSISNMADSVIAGYRDALRLRFGAPAMNAASVSSKIF